MTEKELARANAISEELKKIRDFLYSAEKVWTGRLARKDEVPLRKWLIFSNGYGIFNENSYELDTETKNEMLDVLRRKEARLVAELNEI